jgi:UDP:flavonoid glycosyltransferase YjiC (YdhE family)
MSPSYRIVFYVSGHGFGHASRAIEVVRAVLRARPDAHVVVKSSAPLHLFTEALDGRCESVALQCDAGVVQVDSLAVNTAETIRQAVEFQKQVPALAARESEYLRASGASVVVGDIPPLAIAAAHLAGVPSIAIGNFTWDWIYEGYRDARVPELLAQIRDVHQNASAVLRLPMAGGFAGLDAIARDIPFIARQSSRTQDEVRKALGVGRRAGARPLVLMAFGGSGVAGMSVEALSGLKDYIIATTDSRLAGGAGNRGTSLLRISDQQMSGANLSFPDLVRAADVVVAKPGYGIISEAIANESALLYTSRGDFIEYDVLVREMPRYLRTRFIEQDDLLKGNWKDALDNLMQQPPPPEKPELNGAAVAAAEILRQG